MKTLLIFLIKDNRECRLLRINSQDNSDELHQLQQIVHGLIECVGVYHDDMTPYDTESADTGYELICNEEFLFEPNAEENDAASFLCRQLIKGDTFLVLANYETGEFESIDPHSKSFRVIVNALCKDGIEALIEQNPYDDLSSETYSEWYNSILDELVNQLIDNIEDFEPLPITAYNEFLKPPF